MVFDGHSDIWTDITQRRSRGEKHVFVRRHLRRLQKGGIEGGIFVIWIEPPFSNAPIRRQREILSAIREETREDIGAFQIVTSYEEMLQAKEQGVFYMFLGCEGLAAIGEDLDKIDCLYETGIRHVSLTWNEENALATGIRGDTMRGLTNFGIQAVHEIQKKHMLLDVSHLNDTCFWDVVSHASAPIAATHSSCRSICGASRNLTDDMARAIRGLDGIVGLNAYGDFIAENKEEQTVEALARHIEHMVELMDIDHVGFGFDFLDYLEGEDSSAGLQGMQTVKEVPNLIKALEIIGFSVKEIEKIARENWYSMMRRVLD